MYLNQLIGIYKYEVSKGLKETFEEYVKRIQKKHNLKIINNDEESN